MTDTSRQKSSRTDPREDGPESGPAAANRLRKRIDRGDTDDPSAAPLGTDAEAGGHPPSREEVRRAEKAIKKGSSE
ncbi:hypothetical protein AB9K41_03060 [Cribrihabitans sp. XS_ASV171]